MQIKNKNKEGNFYIKKIKKEKKKKKETQNRE